jgi:omega-amidase
MRVYRRAARGLPALIYHVRVRAHLVQFDIRWEDKPANHRAVRELLAMSTLAIGDLVVLPEMFDTGFSLDIERTNDADGTTRAFLADLARSRHVHVQGGWTRLADDGMGRNHMSVYDPDGTLVCDYAKVHPFSFGREPERFRGGDEVLTFNWHCDRRRLRVCPAVCYDLRFPELFRLGMLAGAEVIAIGANWPDQRQTHWSALLRARAIENQCYALGVNRTGNDPHLAYAGGTVAYDPKGDCIGELTDEEDVLSVPVSPEAVHAWRGAFPAWRDVKLLGRGSPPDAQGDAEERP